MPYRIKSADPLHGTFGLFLKAYDVDAFDGRGHVTWTDDPAKAMTFADRAAAWECWRQQSTVHPIRLTDGKPNRPLSAFTIEIEPT